MVIKLTDWSLLILTMQVPYLIFHWKYCDNIKQLQIKLFIDCITKFPNSVCVCVGGGSIIQDMKQIMRITGLPISLSQQPCLHYLDIQGDVVGSLKENKTQTKKKQRSKEIPPQLCKFKNVRHHPNILWEDCFGFSFVDLEIIQPRLPSWMCQNE